MTLTSHRIIQYIIILLILAIGGGGYWYWKNAQASVMSIVENESGVAGYWNFDEGSGTSAGDTSGNGNTGTLTNSPTWTSGKVGQALSFDGTNDYVSVGAPVVSSYPATLSAWIKVSPGGGGFILSITDTTDWQGWMISASPTAVSARATAGVSTDSIVSVSIDATQWTLVTFVLTSSTSRTLYANNTSVTDTVSRTPSGLDNLSIGRIGGMWAANAAPNYFNGTIDEPRVYNRALSAAEVLALYSNLGAARVNTSQNSQLTNGLVGEWSFNGADISGTTAYDRSTSGLNGTLTNSPTPTIGQVGQGMSFDGTNDYGKVTSFNAGSNIITVSFWLNWTTFANDDKLAIELSPNITGNDKTFYIDPNGSTAAGKVELVIQDSNGGAGASYLQRSFNRPSAGEWHHWVIVFDNSTATGNITAYIDGVAQSMTTNLSTKTGSGNFKTDTLNIMSRNGASLFGAGTLDELRIYNRAITAAEVKDLYVLGEADKINSSVSQSQGTGRLDSALAGYWKLDENTGTSASDASTNGNTGVLTNGPTWTTGQIGSAVSFDGVDDYVETSSGVIADGNSATFSAWVKLNASGTVNVMRRGQDGFGVGWSAALVASSSTAASFSVVTMSGGVAAYAANGTTIFTPGTWYHITGVWAAGESVKIYVNGVLEGTTATTTTTLRSSTVGVRMGRAENVYYNVTLDETRIYARALPADEIARLYSLTVPSTNGDTSLKGYWSFNGQDISGTTARDSSGTGADGVLTNSPTPVIGKLGQGLSFNGSTTYVDLGAPASLNLSSVNKFTLSAWVYPTSAPNGVGVISEMYNPTDTSVQYEIGFDHELGVTVGSKLAVGFYDGAAWRIVKDSGNIPLNQWVHIAGTWDGTTLVLYKDGVVINSATPGGALPSGNFDKVVIGKRHDAGGMTNFFPGRIDEVRIYNRTLTAAQILGLYNLAR